MQSQPHGDSQPPVTGPRSLRLTFEYSDSEIKLVSSQPVEMIAPPSDSVSGYEKQAGFWVEVKDTEDRTLYRRVFHNLIPQDIELFPKEPEGEITRQPRRVLQGSFDVVVPDVDQADTAVLFASLPRVSGDIQAVQEPAREIARVKMRQP